MNANQIFNWLKDPRFAAAEADDKAACFLPVEIVASGPHTDKRPMACDGEIEIALTGGPSSEH